MNQAIEQIVEQAARLGLRFQAVDGKLRVHSVRGGKPLVPPALDNAIREHKRELIDYLADRPYPGWGACPPDALPLRAAPVRLPPEQRKLLIGYVARQLQAVPAVEGWFLERCEIYYSGPAKTWDCADIWLTACADLACWQLQRNIIELVPFLKDFACQTILKNTV